MVADPDMVIYSSLLKEYYDNCFFEEREWLLEMDGRTTPHDTIFRNWQGEVIATRRHAR